MLNFFSNWWKADTPRAHVLGFYEAMKPLHEAHCKQWYLNLAMQRGGPGQWASYEYNSDVLSVPTAPTWRVRPTFNKILPLSITQRHKLLPNNPTINTRPANMLSDIDKKNAGTAQALLRARWKAQDFQDELEEMTLWMVPCTIGYLLTLWDGRAGTEIAPGVWTGEQIFEGVSPFEIIPDYTVSRFKDVPRFLRIKVRSLEYIKYKYKKEVKAQKLSTGDIYQLKAQALMTNTKLDLSAVLEHHTLTMEMYEMPSVKYPDGFHHICTEDVDLTEQKNLDPYYVMDNGNKRYFLPWDRAQMIRLPGALVGTNSVEQATPAQCYYNQGKGLILENQKRLGRPKIFAPAGKIPKGAMIEDPAEIIIEYTDEPGEIVPFKPPEMAQYQLDHIRSLPAEIQDQFGIHDASQGVLPRRATSGKAISFLIEQDEERHIDPKADVDKAVAGAFRKALNICANTYTEERIKDLIGDDGKIIQRKLKGEELRVVDVTITRDTALPKEASARMDLALEILDKKATKEQMEIVFAIMKATDIEDLQAILRGSSEAEEIYARMENFDMAKGFERPVSLGENHNMHIQIHEEFIRNPNTASDAKLLGMRHIQAHQVQAGIEAAARQQRPVETEGEQIPEIPAPAGLPPPADNRDGVVGKTGVNVAM